MKKIKSMLVVAGCVAALTLSSGKVAAQGRGNFGDPTQYISGIVDQMNVADEGEKKAITDAITKVLDARREIGFGGGGMRYGGRRNRGGNTDTNNATASQTSTRRRGGFGAPNPEVEDLQKAIDDKAPTKEVKAKLAKLRESNAAKQAKLETAQADLQKLLSARQEAIAVLNGLLK